MEIGGLPLHPLVVHAVVVFAPLAALVAMVYAAMPAWRWALRWPLVAMTVVAAGGAVLAVLTGQSLASSLTLAQLPQVQRHADRGELLRNVLLAFTVLVAVASVRLGGPTGLASGRGGRRQYGGVLDAVVVTLVVVGATAVLVTAVLAGDSGSRAVWGT